MLSNGLPPPENLLASICCCSLDRPLGSSCFFEVVVCGACTSEVVDTGVGADVISDVDSEVDSDVGSGSPMPRTEDFGASEVVVVGASEVVLCGRTRDVVTGADVSAGFVATSVGAVDCVGTSTPLQTDAMSLFWKMRPRSVRLSTMTPGQTVLRVLDMLSSDETHPTEHAPPA
jgi:hypothetical protein